ncbi:hypothetical protein [Nocardiopsis sp. HUAS JQ3]|uniref:hypothetical protein n=1 Tax=Nocardiopsis sp. HUAS JQ3 TaxID=3061629 RepID=UPI0023A9F1C6|nr:hypothetical protein [Nocardiopsis sp. HUAS JQ3]WDZ88974.1 hypothetical protein PV789_18640 [Nocardiopsis sp. HUAS JQ3]
MSPLPSWHRKVLPRVLGGWGLLMAAFTVSFAVRLTESPTLLALYVSAVLFLFVWWDRLGLVFGEEPYPGSSEWRSPPGHARPLSGMRAGLGNIALVILSWMVSTGSAPTWLLSPGTMLILAVVVGIPRPPEAEDGEEQGGPRR